MRRIFTLSVLLACSQWVPAQVMTGIWRGYFNSSVSLMGDMPGDVKYKFEIQLLQQKNAIKGVSYSYKTTVFYGKADMTGIFTPGNKSLLLKETKLTDLKISGQSEACLMTCYLDYSSIGKMEFLEGTFFSQNIRDKSDCGSGKIHLEKVKESDFGKEDFLLANSGKSKTIPATPAPSSGTKPGLPVPKPPVKTSPATANTGGTAAKVPAVAPNVTNPPRKQAETTVLTPRDNQPAQKESATTDPIRKAVDQPLAKAPIPKVLLERENTLVRTIVTNQEDIRIDLYDNGTIDNDTITVYHNNQLVTSNQRLNFTPITFHIKCNKNENIHEIVVVAENLGDIPPNTALMVVTAGGKMRQEIYLASNEQKNAKVIIEYKPPKQ